MLCRFATPSPFPVRGKRARPGSQSHATPDNIAIEQHLIKEASYRGAEALEESSSAAFTCPLDQPGTTLKAQRDLFGTNANSPIAPKNDGSADSQAAKPARRAKKVVTIDDLAAKGLQQQQQQQHHKTSSSCSESLTSSCSGTYVHNSS
jgi:hypothetical protein